MKTSLIGKKENYNVDGGENKVPANKDFVTPAEGIVQPEAYREIADEYFKDLISEYPVGKISTLSKPLYEKGVLISLRLGFDSIESLLSGQGYKIDSKGVRINKNTRSKNTLIPTMLPHEDDTLWAEQDIETRAMLDYSCEPVSKISEEQKDQFENTIRQMTQLMENTPDINEGSYGYTIRVEDSFFNERTDLNAFEYLSDGEWMAGSLSGKDVCSAKGCSFFKGAPIDLDERYQRHEKVKRLMAMAALFLYPGSNVYVEVSEFSDIYMAHKSFWEEYRKEHPYRSYLIVNSDTGVEIKRLPRDYRFSHKDLQGMEYEKLLKEPLTEDYIDIKLDGKETVFRIRKEVKEGRVCVHGVPLDLYSCVQYDESTGTYVISPWNNDCIQDVQPIETEKWNVVVENENYEVEVHHYSQEYDYRTIMPGDDELRNYPKIPRTDKILCFLNSCEKWKHIGHISKEDLENVILISKYSTDSKGFFTIQTTTGGHLSGRVLDNTVFFDV